MKYFVILIIFVTAFGIVASIVKYTYDSFLEEGGMESSVRFRPAPPFFTALIFGE